MDTSAKSPMDSLPDDVALLKAMLQEQLATIQHCSVRRKACRIDWTGHWT
jgi:hypothetical protein